MALSGHDWIVDPKSGTRYHIRFMIPDVIEGGTYEQWKLKTHSNALSKQFNKSPEEIERILGSKPT